MPCQTCPFAYTEESERAQNYGCLPTSFDIINMKKKSNHNWACHDNETKLCGGLRDACRERFPDLDVTKGKLISYHTWYHEGEEAAILKAK